MTKTELGEFLRSRPERLAPQQQAGVPAGLTVRRVPGLRREEIDHRTDVVGWNRLGHALLAGHLDPEAPDQRIRPNIARMLFLDSHHRALHRDWRAKALVTVAALHQEAARHPDDVGLERLVGESASSITRSSVGSDSPTRR